MYIQYFKDKHFHRLFIAFREKYMSIGRFVGKVTLSNITKEESKDFSLFFGGKIEEGKTYTFTFGQFEKIMLQSKYENFSFYELLEQYFKEPIYSKKEINFSKKVRQELFYQDLLVRREGPGRLWLEKSLKSKDWQSYLNRRYRNNASIFKMELENIMDLLDHLPIFEGEKMTLSLYAGKVTKNPHFLDRGGSNYHLFVKALSVYLEKPYPSTHALELSYLMEVGITQDTLSNFVLTYGLDSSQEIIHSFYKNKESLLLNVQNLTSIHSLYAPTRNVFIFENPSILEAFLTSDQNTTIIITSGNPNLALYIVLDKLYPTHQFYYNGDFDPEGLLIAFNLKKRYPKLMLFGYREKDYSHCLSDEKISEPRLSKLHIDELEELAPIKKCLLETKKAGYQEKNIEYLLSYVKERT